MTTFPVAAGQRITSAIINHAYSLSDTSTHTVTAASMTDLSTVYTIAASDAAANVSYRLTCYGNGTQGSSAQTLSFQLALAGTGVGNAPALASSFAATSSIFRWKATATLTMNTPGTGAQWWGSIEAVTFQNTANGSGEALAGGNSTAFAQDSTVASTFSVQAAWGSATGSPTLTCRGTVFERLG